MTGTTPLKGPLAWVPVGGHVVKTSQLSTLWREVDLRHASIESEHCCRLHDGSDCCHRLPLVIRAGVSKSDQHVRC